MRRKSILLQSFGKESALPDADNLTAVYNFLRSNYGGAWEANEITELRECTAPLLLSAIQDARDADYCFVYFQGSGRMAKTDLPWAEAQLSLSSGEKITERDLNTGSPYLAQILDCYEEGTKLPISTAGRRAEVSEDRVARVEARKAFDQAVAVAERGVVKAQLFSSSAAPSTRKSFIDHLLSASRLWIENHSGVLHLDKAISLAAESMSADGFGSLPEYIGGRRLSHFPFALRL